MPAQAIKDWLSLLEAEANNRGILVDTDIDGRIFHFHLGSDPGVIGKARYSQAKKRNYTNEQGLKHIWHRYNREKELIENGSERKVVNITLDVWDKDEFDPEEHHFLVLTEEMIDEDTYSKGDQKIHIPSDGEYTGPLSKYVDDWDALFKYAQLPRSGGLPTPSGAGPSTNGGSTGQSTLDVTRDGSLPVDTSGTETPRTGTDIRVSDQFKRAVYDRFDGVCPLTGIEHSELLTVSHILGRADHSEHAEEIENVVLLDWTHHMAFDSGLWTFDEAGRVWLRPGFETESPSLSSTLLERRGEKIDDLARVGDCFIELYNENLEWWPPRE